jgi:uncharacterized protein with HEPN domain
MKAKRDREFWLVTEIGRHANAIAIQVSKGRVAFFDTADDAVRGDIEHHVELMAEAANKLSRGFREANPQIPWERLAGLRIDAAHPYDEGKAGPLNPERLWEFAREAVPRIARKLRRPIFPKQ